MRKALLAAALGFCSAASFAAVPVSEPLPPELRDLSKKGIDAIYAVDLPDAQKYFEEALAKYPDHPFPHFGIAMTKWASLEYLEDESNPKLDKEYGDLTDKALDVGRAWVKKHPGDANAYMCLGGMYGLRARLEVLQHRWIKAYFDGKKAISNTRTALKIDPELYDAYLGLGMYEYYAGTLPGVIKILAKLFLSGDAQKGIDMLTVCKDKGYFNALAAKLLLIEIYTTTGSQYENPELAVKWSKELREAYPGHPQMHFVEIVSLFENKQYGESRKESLDYLKAVEDGKPAYRKRYLPRVLTAIGTTYLAEGSYDQAEDYFTQAAATIKADPALPPARWAVWAIVRLGNVYDLKGLRAKAVQYYDEARSYKDEWGFSESISTYLKKPFAAAALPGQMPPP
jgi:tetratricopeptide (TPR) repeat protein